MSMRVIFVSLFLLSACAPRNPDFLNPILQSVSGDCFRQGGKLLRQGDVVRSGDTLLTAYSGNIRLSFNDSDYVVISENTKVVLWYNIDPVFVDILVLHGRVYSNSVILPAKGTYKVHTNKVQTSVKGTAFTLEVDDTGRTVINVLEGVVKVVDNDSLCPIDVRGGDNATINPGKFPCKVRNIGLSELKELVQWVGKSFMKLRKLDQINPGNAILPKLKECDILPESMAVAMVPEVPPPVKRAKGRDDDAERKKKDLEAFFSEVPKAKVKEFEYRRVGDEQLRDPDEIAREITERKVPINNLYNQYLRKSAFKGRVLMRFSINPDGSVDDPVILNSTTQNPDFDEALKSVLLEVRFKKVDASMGPVSIVYPFDFKM